MKFEMADINAIIIVIGPLGKLTNNKRYYKRDKRNLVWTIEAMRLNLQKRKTASRSNMR